MFINIGHGWEPCSPPGFQVIHHHTGDPDKKVKYRADVRQLKRSEKRRRIWMKFYSVVLPFRDQMEFF